MGEKNEEGGTVSCYQFKAASILPQFQFKREEKSNFTSDGILKVLFVKKKKIIIQCPQTAEQIETPKPREKKRGGGIIFSISDSFFMLQEPSWQIIAWIMICIILYMG